LDKVLYLSGTTRGGALECIGRSLGNDFQSLGIECVEISLLDQEHLLENLRRVDFAEIKLVFSWASMGLGITVNDDAGKAHDLWHELGIPFITFHGDSPAYYFDRHIVRDSKIVTIYGFSEHADLRRRLPQLNGPVDTIWPGLLNEIPVDQLDWKKKRDGKLLFLKNGKDPLRLKRFWSSCLDSFLFKAIFDLAAELERNLDNPAANQVDDLITRYFSDLGIDIASLLKLRLFFIAQLDDYLRAVKATKIAEALMDFPVEIRGNDWPHLDFTGKKATFIDECDYLKSIGLIHDSLGLIDVAPNTSSRPHDRLMRAYGAHTFCLTSEQTFLDDLPHRERTGFRFEKDDLQQKVAYLLDNRATTLEMGMAMAEAYSTQHPRTDAPTRMLQYASLAKLDNLRQRPAGSQDFFVWPPTRL